MTYVFLAGIGNSETDHWQSIWYRALGGHWVDHANWSCPRAADWVADLDRVLQTTPGAKILVAHRLGCLLAVEWARQHRDPSVIGSFLVAPPDARGACFPTSAVGFAPASDAAPPPLPALVVASTTDPYAGIASARAAATCWGADFADVGALGHINLASNIGGWQSGRALLDTFVARLARP